MAANELEKLDKVLAMGKWQYVVKHGVLGWGVLTAILYTGLMYLTSSSPLLQTLLISLVLFGLGGIFWGLFMWYFINRRRNKIARQ
ncbi:hypothetical protein [Pseudoalteromonas sp. 120-MNA-CIBAN-0494]|uniref:hypothetical protein n=1 Tax=Pseudoalteromonas TaxID=53246 RepID=UPI003318D0C6